MNSAYKTIDDSSSRQKSEEAYYDNLARDLSGECIISPAEFFESPTSIEARYVLKHMGLLKGKSLLDLGCGTGQSSVYLAEKGASVTAVDISEKMVECTKKLAQEHGANLTAEKGLLEELKFKDESFDLVFGCGILHHINYDEGIKEVRRVLRPGGKALFIEPLAYNPIIKLYRALAGANRTPEERPLTFSQIRDISNDFSRSSHHEFWLSAQLLFIYYFLFKRYNPSKVKYWIQIIKDGYDFRNIAQFLFKIDRLLISFLPFLSRMCWRSVIILEK